MGQLTLVGVGLFWMTFAAQAAAEPARPAPAASGPATAAYPTPPAGASSDALPAPISPPPGPSAAAPSAAAPSAAAPSGAGPTTAPSAATGAGAAAPGPYPAYPGYPGYPPPPPPGYPGYPPPYGYYYYAPPPPPPPRFPRDAAVTSTPFVDAIAGGANWENRFSQFLHVGAQAGLYVGGRLRLVARIALPTDHAHDEYYDGNYNYSFQRAKDYSLVYGASAGIVAVSTSSFVLSPGVLFARTDVSDYGTMLGLSAPFEWVLGSGVRVGFEVALGRAFGGQVAACSSSACNDGASRDRPSGTGFWLHFQFGYGFNHPEALPAARPPLPVAGTGPSAPR